MGSKTYALMAKKFATLDRTTLGKIQEQARVRAKALRDEGEGAKHGVTGKLAEAHERLAETQRAARAQAEKTPQQEIGREDKTGALLTGTRGGRYYLSKSTGEKVYVK
jgi:di/tripeptidase